ncbi:hypothetical protein BGZ98_009703, partial [Dissophora globulifera]
QYLAMALREEVERQTNQAIHELTVMLKEDAAIATMSGLLDWRGGCGGGGDAYVFTGVKPMANELDTIHRYTRLNASDSADAIKRKDAMIGLAII